MSRKLLVETSEGGRSIIDYASLRKRELDERIRAYEKKYGMPFSTYHKQFDCDRALPWESGDLIDWESLVRERKTRQPKANGKKRVAAGKQ